MRHKLESLTAREREEMQYYADERELERQHAIKVKELELAVEKEISKFKTLLRLPRLLLLLPILPLVVIVLIINAIRNQEPSDKIINLFK